MLQQTRNSYSTDEFERLLSGVTLFNEIKKQDPSQYALILDHVKIIEASSSEIIIHKGDTDPYLYFLVRGQLAVLPENDSSADQAFSMISPGEIFGTWALVLGKPRTACIRTDQSVKSTVLIRLDYALLSDFENLTIFNLFTKISFFRMLANNIRWTLEVNRMESPSHPLVVELRNTPLFRGEKNSMSELVSLKDQATSLANLLVRWNNLSLPQSVVPDQL